MRKLLTLAVLSLLCAAACNGTQQPDSFTIEGEVNLPDGYMAGLVVHTDTAFSVSLCDEIEIKDGKFLMAGKADTPCQGTLMTNNLKLVEQNHWPQDSIRWTYSEVFVSNGALRFTLDNPLSKDPQGRLTGTRVQEDYNEWLDMGKKANPWKFIEHHPQSAISVWLALQLTKRAYRLTAKQADLLATTLQECPDDTLHLHMLQQCMESVKRTVKGSPVADLELTDRTGQTCHLTDVLPKNGHYVLVDFWASWCGICIYSMPDVEKMAEDFKDCLQVIAVSIDEKEDAWNNAMEKHPEPWPQYRTTKRGYERLFTEYQIGNGVPYYLLVSPDGHVVASPESPAEARQLMEELKNINNK